MKTKDVILAVAIGALLVKACDKKPCPCPPKPPKPPCKCVYKRYFDCGCNK